MLNAPDIADIRNLRYTYFGFLVVRDLKGLEGVPYFIISLFWNVPGDFFSY